MSNISHGSKLKFRMNWKQESMNNFNSKPGIIAEAVFQYLFLLENTNAIMTCGASSLKRALTEFSKLHGSIKLSDSKGIQSALAAFFNFNGNIPLHNERSFGMGNLFGWLYDKKYVEQDYARNYVQIS